MYKRQTTDAEYIAACQAVKEIVWLHKLSKDLGILHQMNTSLYVDNMRAIQLIKNPVYHKRTKHIDIKYHYIREKYEESTCRYSHEAFSSTNIRTSSFSDVQCHK